MTKNIIKLKLLIIFLFICCNNKNNKTLYYNFYNSKDSISLFIIKSIDIKDNKRKEIDSFFNTKGKLENIKHNTFIVDDYSLSKVTTKTKRPYLTIKNKNCIEYIFDNELATFAHTNRANAFKD